MKDADLGGYFRRRHPHVRNVRYGSAPRSDAWHKGREAGEKLVLRRGVRRSGRVAGACSAERTARPAASAAIDRKNKFV